MHSDRKTRASKRSSNFNSNHDVTSKLIASVWENWDARKKQIESLREDRKGTLIHKSYVGPEILVKSAQEHRSDRDAKARPRSGQSDNVNPLESFPCNHESTAHHEISHYGFSLDLVPTSFDSQEPHHIEVQNYIPSLHSEHDKSSQSLHKTQPIRPHENPLNSNQITASVGDQFTNALPQQADPLLNLAAVQPQVTCSSNPTLFMQPICKTAITDSFPGENAEQIANKHFNPIFSRHLNPHIEHYGGCLDTQNPEHEIYDRKYDIQDRESLFAKPQPSDDVFSWVMHPV